MEIELKDLKKKSEKELQELLASSREKLRVARFKDANKQLKDVREIRHEKKLVAQVLTLLNSMKK
jgi:ribosomal protein L29